MRDQDKSITELARELRKNPTLAEQKLWKVLRRHQLSGYRFLRQKPIIYNQRNHRAYFFIADFYCAEANLVIELDGQYHQNREKYDRNRDLVIQKLGLQVLRIKNKELNDMDKVIEHISHCLKNN